MGFIIIPDAIKSMQKLNPNAKLLYGDILSLSAQNGYCFASNEYLSKIYGVTTRSISNLISQLYEFGVIDIKNDSGQYGKVRTIFPIIQAEHEQTFLPPRTNVPRTNVPPPTNERSDNIEQTFHEHRTNVPKDTNERSTIIDNIKDNRIDKLIDNNNKEKSDFSFLQNDPEIIALNDKKQTQEILPAVVYQKPKKEKAPQIYPANFSPAIIRAVENFIEYRKEIKKPFKSEKSQQTKVNQWSDQIEAYGDLIVLDSIETAIANGWQGTFIDMKKVEQLNKQQNNSDNQFKTKEDATFSYYFSQLRDVDYGFND